MSLLENLIFLGYAAELFEIGKGLISGAGIYLGQFNSVIINVKPSCQYGRVIVFLAFKLIQPPQHFKLFG
jgi:hypothetical protein